jgi:signal transduction histidine kinase
MWRPRLAWAMFGLTVVCVVAQTLVLADQRSLLSRRTFENGWPIIGVAGVIGALFGALIVSRYPTHRIGWLLVVGQLLTSVGMVADAFAGHILTGHGWGSRSLGHWIEWFSAYVNATPALAFVAAIFLLAPDGYLLSPRWRPAFWLVVLALVLNTAGVLVTDPQSLRYSGEQRFSTTATILLNTAVFCVAGAILAGAVSLVRRLRRAEGEERLQLRWIAASATFMALVLVFILTWAVVTTVDSSSPVVLPLLLFLAYASLPVCTGVAVLRHRLYDVDLIVNRAVLLALATGFALAGYVALVVLIGGRSDRFWPSLVATVLVALAFQPLRTWVVRLADRAAYGTRAAPYEALSDLTRVLGDAPDPTTLLPAVAEAAGRAVSAEQVVVRFTIPGRPVREARWHARLSGELTGPETRTTIPVGDDGLCTMEVTPARGRSLRDHERDLLGRLAEQAALAFRNAGLSAELAGRVAEADRQGAELDRSRRRLIDARDEERARLSSVVREDVVAHLVTLPAQLRALADDETGDREDSLAELVDAAVTSLEALREMTRGVYPTQLARAGLGPALSSHLTRWGRGTLVVEDSAADARFAGRVEAAAYFCFAEGVRDFAPPVELVLRRDGGDLVLTMTGRADGDAVIERMRDRVETLGGSVRRSAAAAGSATRLTVRIPAEPVVGYPAAVPAASRVP